MDVSVIIVNYNTFNITCNCIRSVLEKTRDLSYEIIVVDNASTERDPAEFKTQFPSITLISSDVNLGFAKGNNLGMATATGTYILLLNSDTLLINNAIHLCRGVLDREARIAVVGARLEYPDGTVQHSCQRFPSIRYRLFELLRLQKLASKNQGGKILLGFFFDHNEPVEPDWIWGTFFMFRRHLLQTLPGNKLADDFFMYGEDMQWCLEFRRRGHAIAFEPKARVVHLMGKSGGKANVWLTQNMEIVMRRYYSVAHRRIIQLLDAILIPKR